MIELPRNDYVSGSIVEATPIFGVGSFLSDGLTGAVSTRRSNSRGWSWEEGYGNLNMRYHETNELLSFVRFVWGQGRRFLATHPIMSGSGKRHLGATSDSLHVSGAAQSGDSINVAGFTPNQEGALLPGTLIQFNSHNSVYQVSSRVDSNGSGAASVGITPSLDINAAPDDLSAVKYNDIKFTVVLSNEPVPPSATSLYWAGARLSFTEVYNVS